LLSQSGAPWSALPPVGPVLEIPGVNEFLSGTPGDRTQDFWPGPLIEQHPSGAQHAVSAAQTPEPSSFALFGFGIAGLAVWGWQRLYRWS
jgi:hypothetical protein